MISNRQHVKDLKEALHATIAGYGIQQGLGEGELAGGDVMVALGLVIRDIVRSAPDSESRTRLVNDAVQAILAQAPRPALVHPAGHRLHS